MSIETDIDGKEKEEIETQEKEIEAAVQPGLSKEALLEVFNADKIENLIDKQASEVLELQNRIKMLEAGDPSAAAVLDHVIRLKDLKLEKLERWVAIQDLVRGGNITEEAIDTEVAQIKLLAIEIKEQLAKIQVEEEKMKV